MNARPSKFMRSFEIQKDADLMLPTIATLCGCPNVSEYLRRASVAYAEQKLGSRAQAFKIALHQTARQAALILIGTSMAMALTYQSMRGNMDGARQARVGLRMVRTSRGFRFEREMV